MININSSQEGQGIFILLLLPECLLHAPGYNGHKIKHTVFAFKEVTVQQRQASKETISTQGMHIINTGKHRMFVIAGKRRYNLTKANSEDTIMPILGPCPSLFQPHLLSLALYYFIIQKPSGHNILSQVSRLLHVKYPRLEYSPTLYEIMCHYRKFPISSSIYPCVR